MNIKNFFLLCLVFGLSTFNQNALSQLEQCVYLAPPFEVDGTTIDHFFGANVHVTKDSIPFWYCTIDGQYISNELEVIHLGAWIDYDGPFWNPFWYELIMSQPVVYLEFLLFNGSTGNPFLDIDYGAENFVFESDCSELDLEIIHACNSIIEGDTIYLGVGNTGSGIFSVSFSEPVKRFRISGKGGGYGSGFAICANSIVTAPLWACLSAPPTVCSTGAAIFTAYGSAAPYTFTYTVNGGSVQILQSAGSSNMAYLNLGAGSNFPAPGTYEIQLLSVTDNAGNTEIISCNNTQTVTVADVSPPNAQFMATPNVGFVPLQVNLTNQSTNATQYEWLLNNTPITPQNNTITLQDTGAYQITLIASNALGCTDTTVQTVHVLEQLQVTIPNVFTPNNDDVNDWFGITTNVEAEANLVILNRWGGVVFEKSFVTNAGDFMELWDGTSTGSVATPSSVPATDGVYFYKVVLSGEAWEETFVGNVTLRR